ncbi:putative outermembrane protein [hydrothermal vent metagenome]|uniref:Putative outermembrane protein n=1 Tax=hydrothermal vent metagenome TaxID=652676 RepID=A0A3B0Y6V6_9ZZZZ
MNNTRFLYNTSQLSKIISLLTIFLSLYLTPAYCAVKNTAQARLTANSDLQLLIAEAQNKSLANREEWLNLLHYKSSGDGSKHLSQVDDLTFFYAENGATNPQNELTATLKAFYITDVTDPDNHAQCRFIARFNWLKSQLNFPEKQLPAVSCPQYTEWSKHVPAHKMSLIFPAYHLNSPSSMFGHTLLRIDPAEKDKASTWLSMAVNFGANIENNDNSMLFAVKGLAGGYSGTFIVTPYYKKIKEYNRYENRDIWEYTLNLTPQETQRMVLHLWELKNIKFDYYFFDENCSYRLLELLQVARPGLKLTEQFGLTAIPVDTVRSIVQAGLTEDIVYRPSQFTNINHLLSQLNDQQKEMVLKISKNTDLVKSDEFTQQDQQQKNIMLDAAYGYLRYQQNDTGKTEANAHNSYQLLEAISNTPEFDSLKAGFTDSQRPEKGHLSRRIALNAGVDNDINFAEFEFRMSFHSLEDRLGGFLQGAQINIGDLSVRATEDRLQLERLNLVDIFSLTPRNQFFTPLSWKVYTGLEQQIINGEEHLTGHVTGGAGVSYDAWSKAYIYALATARLEANSQYTRLIEPALGMSTGLLQHFSSGTAHLEISGEEFLNRDYRQRVKYTQNLTLARNHALQLSILRQRQPDIIFTEARLSYHYFFH